MEMKITVKLFATFRLGRFDIEIRDYPPGTLVGDVVKELDLADQQLGILLVNHRHVQLDYQLNDGETLAIFPLVGGG
jgi:molybdopterin converting factor small subunit